MLHYIPSAQTVCRECADAYQAADFDGVKKEVPFSKPQAVMQAASQAAIVRVREA